MISFTEIDFNIDLEKIIKKIDLTSRGTEREYVQA